MKHVRSIRRKCKSCGRRHDTDCDLCKKCWSKPNGKQLAYAVFKKSFDLFVELVVDNHADEIGELSPAELDAFNNELGKMKSRMFEPLRGGGK